MEDFVAYLETLVYICAFYLLQINLGERKTDSKNDEKCIECISIGSKHIWTYSCSFHYLLVSSIECNPESDKWCWAHHSRSLASWRCSSSLLTVFEPDAYWISLSKRFLSCIKTHISSPFKNRPTHCMYISSHQIKQDMLTSLENHNSPWVLMRIILVMLSDQCM